MGVGVTEGCGVWVSIGEVVGSGVMVGVGAAVGGGTWVGVDTAAGCGVAVALGSGAGCGVAVALGSGAGCGVVVALGPSAGCGLLVGVGPAAGCGASVGATVPAGVETSSLPKSSWPGVDLALNPSGLRALSGVGKDAPTSALSGGREGVGVSVRQPNSPINSNPARAVPKRRDDKQNLLSRLPLPAI